MSKETKQLFEDREKKNMQRSNQQKDEDENGTRKSVIRVGTIIGNGYQNG